MPIRWGHGPAAERGCGGGLPSGWRQISRFGRNVVVPGYFKMRSRFVDYPGLFVIHCHILAHEDRGMMMVVEVRPPPTALRASIVPGAISMLGTTRGIVHAANGDRFLTSPFDAMARSFDRYRALPNGVAEAVRTVILDALSSGPNGGARPRPRLLDVGAGTGRIGWPFVAAGDDYVGVDLSYGMLRAFACRCGRDHPRALVMADGCALPFANANFDAVLLVQVFGGLQDWRRLVDQGRRVLRPDGALILGRTVRPDEGVDARMRQHLVTLLGTTPERLNTREAAEQYLTAIASTTSHLVAAVWGAECSPRAFLDRHTGGARFLQLPQAGREHVIHALTLWAQTQFGGLDEMFLETYRFEMRVFKFSRG